MSGDPISDFLTNFGVNPEIMVISFAAAVATVAVGIAVAHAIGWLLKPPPGGDW